MFGVCFLEVTIKSVSEIRKCDFHEIQYRRHMFGVFVYSLCVVLLYFRRVSTFTNITSL